MNEGEKTTHWHSLAEELGADPPAEQPAQPQPDEPDTTSDVDQQQAEAELSPGRRKRSAEPKRSAPRRPNHWGALAGELGLEVPADEPVLPELPESEVHADSSITDDVVESNRDEQQEQQEWTDFEDESDRTSDLLVESSVIPSEVFDELEAPPSDFLDDVAEAVDLTLDADDEADASADTAADEADQQEDSEERPRKRRRRRRRSSRRTSEQEPAAEQDDSEQEEDTPSESGRGRRRREDRDSRAKHRSIPTWEEAINVVVSSNIESRSKSSSGSGRRGRGRGRRGSSNRSD